MEPISPTLIAASAVLVVYALLWLGLGLYIHYNSWLEFLAWRMRGKRPACGDLPSELPVITIQLPIYNESAVVERLLEAVNAIDYPRELLQVQLLDDSTDQCAEIARKKVAELHKQGLDITHVRRTDRHGYKAGALADAFADVRGEFVLLLDADFVPDPCLLLRLLPYFSDPEIAMVQARWGHLQRPTSVLEHCVVHWIDRHFEVDQVARSRSGRFWHFNGSAGIWRTSAIADSGGWSADTLAEDLDLSLRAFRRGWRFIYEEAVEVPAEVPSSLPAYVVQQDRWARGAIQCAKKMLPELARSTMRRVHLFETALHLTGYLFPSLLLLVLLASPAAVWAGRTVGDWTWFMIDLPLVLFAAGMAVRALIRGMTRGWHSGWVEVLAMVVGIGLSPTILKAIVSALIGRKKVGFRRTPKSGGQGTSGGRSEGNGWPELLLSIYFAGAVALAVQMNAWAAQPLFIFATIGFLYVAAEGFAASAADRARRSHS